MTSASGFVALLGAIASFGSALPINATAGHPNAGCSKRSCPFSFTNPNGQCGEVDAAARMPDDIWNNQSAVAAYVAVTVKYYNVGGAKLENALCKRAGHIPYGVTDNVAWTNPELMKATCGAVCGCHYPACPDEPATTPGFCSLCGPKFNQPVIVTMFKPGPTSLNECAPTFGLGGSVCVQNPEIPALPELWATGQNRAACQARCDFMDRGGCCQFSNFPQGQYQGVDCYFYPEGSSASSNASFLSEQTLPCIQPPPPPPSVCGNGQARFGPGGNDCQTGPNSPEGVYEPTVTWNGHPELTAAQAILFCEAEGKTGCCGYQSSTGITTFIAGGVNVPYGIPTYDMTAACTAPPPPAPRPPARCQPFGSRPGIQCEANPDTTAPDRQPRQWFFIAPEVCFAECAKQGKTGCCDHTISPPVSPTDPSPHGICQFWSGGTPSLRPDPGGQYADMYAGSCIGPSCKTGLEFACGSARKEGVFKCGECAVERKDQLTQCSETEEEQFCESTK